MAIGGGSSGKGMSEINVTPLVDVMLVLMIIFMVTAPMIQQGVEVDLPEANAPAMPADDKTMIITVTKDKRVLVGDAEIPYDQLREKLGANQKLRQEKEVYLHADRALSYGTVVDIMAILKEAGVENLGMVTDPVSGETP